MSNKKISFYVYARIEEEDGSSESMYPAKSAMSKDEVISFLAKVHVKHSKEDKHIEDNVEKLNNEINKSEDMSGASPELNGER